MKLFYSPGACSLAPHILLRETESTFTLEKVELAQHTTQEGGDYYRVNPKGQVPLLVLDDGTSISEGPIIAQFIADRAKHETLMPAAGTMARYRVMEWQNYITSELHKSYAPLVNPHLDDSAKRVFRTSLREKYQWLNTQLVDTDYLTGSSFTAADAYLYAVTGWAKYVELDLSDLKQVEQFLNRVSVRPKVQEALKAEGLIA